jgi:hypothetical protein
MCNNNMVQIKIKKKEKKPIFILESYLEPVPANANERSTRVSIIARTATVTINGSHELAIGARAAVVFVRTALAPVVIPVVAANLSRVNTPTPNIRPTSTSISTS